MRLGVFDDGLAHLDLPASLAWCAGHGLAAIELGVGAWGVGNHLDLDALLRDAGERDRLAGALREHDLALSCVNAAGNPLHPDSEVAADHVARIRGAVELAHELGVGTVVTMSGCPAGPGSNGGISIFPSWALNADYEDLLAWQFEHAVEPFWRELSAWAAEAAPGVSICIELHAGCWAYNPQTFLDLRAVTGPNVKVNLDPSHFWWQGIDPILAIELLAGHIGHAHAKDTLLNEEIIRRRGLFDLRPPIDPAEAPWVFAAVGRGHDDATWRRLVDALRTSGYDGDLSIEHEDPAMDNEAGITTSIATLQRVV